ncbi:MAG TPA: amidohydrolase family protein [Candidatus Acidoferrales bacterium]|nr:amidohydrolase family protein [Candidatus Acidoferrales bacterium]
MSPITLLSKHHLPPRLAISAALCSISLCLTASSSQAQASPLPPSDAAVRAEYDRLRPQIEKIPIFDNHAHPAFADDTDVDAMAAPEGESEAYRIRASNPELAEAAKRLFGYPYPDFSPEHAKWLADKTTVMKKQEGAEYFSNILDRVGIETVLANRVAMPEYLKPSRFRWVFFVDSFLFPFENSQLEKRDSDEALYLRLQERVLRRYIKQENVSALPEDLAGYEALIRSVAADNQKHGGVAMKFEAAYFRSLYFTDPSREEAERIYRKYHAGGVPTDDEYRIFQDYVFRRLLDDALALRLPVHFHSAVGIGDFYRVEAGNGMRLENVLRDPRYLGITFVLLHGCYPHEREAIWLAAMKNVYLDSSFMELLMYPSQLRNSLRQWLEVFPDKIVYGSDAFPFNDALGAEVTFEFGARSARTALAAALAEMVTEGEVSEARALELARGYLHDNAAKLYPPLK